VAELNRLLQQQTEAIQGKFGAIEAEEGASRSGKIRELFRLLNHQVDSLLD